MYMCMYIKCRSLTTNQARFVGIVWGNLLAIVRSVAYSLRVCSRHVLHALASSINHLRASRRPTYVLIFHSVSPIRSPYHCVYNTSYQKYMMEYAPYLYTSLFLIFILLVFFVDTIDGLGFNFAPYVNRVLRSFHFHHGVLLLLLHQLFCVTTFLSPFLRAMLD